ncbi:phosphotransferase family protein [Paenibacillus kobensis]|uniref:phosphotransferase family protein n=1 Tax=Paenibacillus kobensis TaxID=59841 RepID=UPI0013E34009|nr:phosphotransferase [Paenibacillus kobensis]
MSNEKESNAYISADEIAQGLAVMERELLYAGLNGCRVERVQIGPDRTVVCKITPDLAQAAREARLYADVLPKLPDLYPALLDYAETADADGSRLAWLVFEDAGVVTHTFNEQAMAELIGYMAQWHAVPTEGVLLGSERGQKPDYEEIVADLLTELGWNWRGGPTAGAMEREAGAHRSAVAGAAASVTNRPGTNVADASEPAGEARGDGYSEPLVFGLPEHLVLRVYGQMKQQPPVIVYRLSHGDLHAGNFGTADDGTLKVLDWEHVHRNSPYWDLYHALDMSHPMFPRTIEDEARERLLAAYWEQAKAGSVPADREAFMREYSLFSAVFSLWMLRLIASDLEGDGGPWPRERLLRQQEETRAAFLRCAKRLQQG